jgi:phosphate transport system permease protein
VVGSFFMLALTLLLSFPIGVAGDLSREFAGRNRWTDVIEVAINNLPQCRLSYSACLTSQSS